MIHRLNAVLSLCFLSLLLSCGEDVSKNRKSGKTEVTQPDIEGDESIRSFIHRRSTSAVLSYKEEIAQTIAGTLNPQRYIQVPDMAMDDEGTNDLNIQTRTGLGRPSTVCGAAADFKTISARISDCETKNGATARWEGVTSGAAGEGNWRLVSLATNGKEIWKDERTGMLWSDAMVVNSQSKFNWCKASGNTQGATTNMVVDCQSLSDSLSVCYGTQTENFGTQISWRLPTRNDYLQADLDGLRFVLRFASDETLWTATMTAGVAGRNEAWIYTPGNGTLSSSPLTNETYVRCIGAPAL